MKHLSFFFIVCGLLSGQVSAGTMGSVPKHDCTWLATITGGPFWSNGGKTQTFFLSPEIEKTYVNYSTTTTQGIGELFLALQRNLSEEWIGQFGVAAAFTGDVKLQGHIWDDAEPQFDNYIYRYQLRHGRVTAKGKLIVDKGYWAMPWVGAGIGVGFNRSHHFTNAPLIPEAVPNEDFRNHTKTAFTYTINAGFQMNVNLHWQLGLSYEFADWGKSSLSPTVGQTFNRALSLNHLYTHGLLVSLTYLV